jgi:limonene-1,2-epoxide hydrolase
MEGWDINPPSIEAGATILAAVLAGIAAWFSLRISSRLVKIEEARSLREKEHAAREEEAHQALMEEHRENAVPHLTLQPDTQPSGTSDIAGRSVTFVGTNDGSVPALKVRLLVLNEGQEVQRTVTKRVDARSAFSFQTHLASEWISEPAGDLKPGLVIKVVDDETGQSAEYTVGQS